MYKEFESIENLEKIIPDSNEFVVQIVKMNDGVKERFIKHSKAIYNLC